MMDDSKYMELAIEEAKKAYDLDEVPIGAVVVLDGEVVGRGHNEKETRQDATAHAEILALRQAMENLGAWRLTGAVLYVTIEPCVMCVGALIQSRVARIVFGARDSKFGGVVSLHHLADDARHNHRMEYTEGILADEARKLMQDFFKAKR